MRVLFVKKDKIRIMVLIVLLSVILVSLMIFHHIFIRYPQTVTVLQPIYNGPQDRKVVTITCNVDWGNEYIPPMLEIFHENNIKATFFVTGRWADQFPELLAKIHSEGHIIGNHGYQHKDFSKMDYGQNHQQIHAAQNSIKRVTGMNPVYFAPPSGAFNRHTLDAARDLGCKVIMWSIDSIDWKRDGTDRIISRVNKRLCNGGIILIHPTDQTVEALPAIVKNINEAGYEIISLEQLVKMIEIN